MKNKDTEYRELKFRVWQKANSKMLLADKLKNISKAISLQEQGKVIVMQCTGFKDKSEPPIDIYEGDILSDLTQTDEGIVLSKMQVFWNEPTGSWHLDNSYHQDQTCSVELWLELNDFKYVVNGNIYENAVG